MPNNLVLPKTYLTGFTSLNFSGLEEYLKDSDQLEFLEDIQEAREKGLSDGEILCSFYAKMCYASLTTKKNNNISKIRGIYENILGTIESQHGSVLEHCSVNFLTTNCSRVFTHELVRHRVGSAYCLSGDTLVYSGSKINGRWNGVRKKWKIEDLYKWYSNKSTKYYLNNMMVRCWDGDQFIQAKIKNVIQSGVKQLFKLTLEDGKKIKASKDHLFLTKEGWKTLANISLHDYIATNGEICYKSKDWLTEQYLKKNLTQKEIGKIVNKSEACIKSWLRKNNITKDHKGYFQLNHSPWNKDLSGYASRKFSQEECDKISNRMLKEKNHQWKGDNVSKNGARQRAIREFKQDNCSFCNDPSGHRHHKDRNVWNNTSENIQFLCNSCHAKLHYLEDGSKSKLVIKWIKVENITQDISTMTYDLEVDHGAHNFVANGIVTHNSQTSGRYVRTDEINFVHDPILDPVKDEILEGLNYIQDLYNRMEEKIGIDKIKDFGIKKKLTSALRRILPNGQANEIGFSLNIRSLRHLIELRTSRHAEWEIRLIFGQVYDLIRTIFPAIFLDSKIEIIEGLREITFKNKKI